MKPVDYKCLNCNFIEELLLSDTAQIINYITCKECGGFSKRMFSAPGIICHQGKAGNYKNGYTSSPVKIKKT